MEKKLSEEGANLLVNSLETIKNGNPRFIDQDNLNLMYKSVGLDSKGIELKVTDILNSNVILQKKN